MTHPNSSRLISFEAAIKEHLKCIKCQETMWPPIRHCERGHSFCEKCYNSCKGIGCLKCGDDCHGNRTHHLERMFEFLTFTCKYADIGCEVTLPYDDMKRHEVMCLAFWSFCLDPWIKSPDSR